MRIGPRNRWMSAGVAGVALGAAFLAPLATSAPRRPTPSRSPARDHCPTGSPCSSRAPSPSRRSTAHVLAYNDFHGNLEPARLNIYGQFAGGAAYLAKLIARPAGGSTASNREATVFAGDNIGASPLANALFHEEPATIIANLMHVDFASVGNHEFDKGSRELKRIQNGGCPTGGCNGAPYLLPNGKHDQPLPGRELPVPRGQRHQGRHRRKPSSRRTGSRSSAPPGGSVKVGFIGEVLKDTPTIVTPSGVAGLTFGDEAAAANKAVADLKAKGVNVPILVVHQGGFQSGPAALNGCAGNLAGSPIEDIAAASRPVDQDHHLGPHPRRVPLHDHDSGRCDPAGHQRLVVRPDPVRPHAQRSTSRPARWSARAPRTSSSRTRSTPPAPASSGSRTPRSATRRSPASSAST